jgi:PAS domain S-box-containing protein
MARRRIVLSLSLRIILLSIALVALIAGALSYLSSRNVADAVHQEYADKGRLAALMMDVTIQSYYGTLADPKPLQRIIDAMMAQEASPFYRISLYGQRVTQEGTSWQVIASSDSSLLGQPAGQSELVPLGTDRVQTQERTLDGTPVLEVLAPVHAGGAPYAVLGIYVDLRQQNELLAAQRWQTAAVTAGGVSLLVLLLYGALHFLFIRPIGVLTNTSRRLAAGEYVPPPMGERHDEIGVLAQAFRDMADSLQQREVRLIEEAARRQESLRLEANRLAALSEISHAVNSLQEVGEIFRFLVGRVRGLIPFERFSIALLDPQATSWSVAYAHGMTGSLPTQPYSIAQGLPGWTMQSGEAILVPDLAADERANTAAEQELIAQGCRSAIVVPLHVEGAIAGTLNLGGQGTGAYGPGELALLTLLGRQVETALQHARLLQRERRRAEQLRALAEVDRQIASILDPETLLQRIGQIIQETFGFYRVNAGLIEGEDLVFRARVGEEGQPLASIRLKVGQEGITGQVAGTGQPYVSGDITQDPHYVAAPPPEVEQTASELAVPIAVAGQTVGVLDVQSKARNAFGEEDVGLLQTLAGHLAVALENARLYSRARQERDAVELLYKVGQELSAAMDMEEVLPRVLALVVEKTGAFRGSVIVTDSMGNPRHHILVREDLSPSVVRLLVQEVLRRGLAGWVTRNRQAALVFDTSKDPRWLELPETLKGVHSAMAVPLMRRDTLVGVLTLVHRQVGFFNESHLELVTSVANQAAITIDNARLLLDAQRRVAQLNALLEINQGLSSDQPIQEVLDLITLSAHGLLDASNTVLYLVDEASKTLVPTVALGADSVIVRQTRLQVGEGLSGLVVQTKRSYILNEAHLSSISKHLEGTPLEPEAMLAVPLLQRNQAVGVLAVSRYGEGIQFDTGDREIAELLASQAVVALSNARLYEQARRRADDMASLNRIARTVGSTLDLDEVLRQVIAELNRSFHVEAGSILLVDREHSDLFFATTLEGGLERFLDVRIPMGVGIVGDVAKTGKPAMVNDPASDPRHYSKISSDVGFVNRNILCVPLFSRDRVIGVIELLNKEEGEFGQDDLERLQGIAATVAVAIENARLYAQTEEERGRLTAILTSTADAVIATDAQQRILLINPAAAQAFRMDPYEKVGQPFQEALAHPGLRGLFSRAASIDHGFTDELTVETAEGRGQTLRANISPVRGAGGQTLGHVAAMQDITTLKELDKMKSEFVSVVSHDLKTPLTAIRGFADLVNITGPLEQQQKEFVGKIKEITVEMAAMISDLLDIGKIEAGIEMEQVPCDVAALAADVVSDLEFRAREKQIAVEMDVADPSLTVVGDPSRLKQVLMNLVGNAIKYTPEGGHVSIRIFPEDGRLITAVRDNGVGISALDQKQLFQKFYRVRSDQTAHIEGTGLGLAIARSIVERHRGRIWVESEPGKGSTFAFSLPLSAPGV